MSEQRTGKVTELLQGLSPLSVFVTAPFELAHLARCREVEEYDVDEIVGVSAYGGDCDIVLAWTNIAGDVDEVVTRRLQNGLSTGALQRKGENVRGSL